jgi:creatinine amidohydrolase
VDPARQTFRLEELSWPQAQTAIEAGAIAVLPVGSLEQHGRHLAINTDNVLGDAVAEAAVHGAVARGVHVLLCPPLHYGYTMHNMDFPGTMTLRTETLLAVGVDLVTSLVHHGCKKIVLLNSHGSNWSRGRRAATAHQPINI